MLTSENNPVHIVVILETVTDQMAEAQDKPWLWSPGQSGNPSGRPKVMAEIRELARKKGPGAFRRIVWLARKAEDERVRLRANEVILERAYGKPTENVDLTLNLGDTLIAAMLEARMRRLNGDVPGEVPSSTPLKVLDITDTNTSLSLTGEDDDG